MPILSVDGTIIKRPRKGRLKPCLTPQEHASKRRQKRERRRARKLAVQTQVALKPVVKIVKPTIAKKPAKRTPIEQMIEADPVRDYQAYALQLEDGKFYVGITGYKDVMRRFDQHATGKGGAKWTKLHPPIRVTETRQLGHIHFSEAAYLEDQITLEYMLKHGAYNVRGGSICQLDEKRVDQYIAKVTAKWRPIPQK